MPAYFNLIDKIKRYFWLSQHELIWVLISIGIVTIMIGFDDGSKTFELSSWITNLLQILFIVALAVIVHETAHRIYALHIGFQLEFKPFFYGLVAGLIVMLLTLGKVFFIAYGSFEAKLMRTHRLGQFRYGLNYFAIAAIAAIGPIANMALATAFRMMTFLPEGFVHKAVLINVMFAIYNLLPIPLLDGAQVFFGSKVFYALVIGLVAGWSVFLLLPTFSLLAAIIGSIALSLIFGAVMVLFEEKIIG